MLALLTTLCFFFCVFSFRARCKQHPQNNSLLHTFVREMFVAKENNGELLLYLASG